MDRKIYTIALGGMLHDIGKFMQRAELENDYPEIRDNFGNFCPLSKFGSFTHLHAAYSAFFVERFVPEGLFDKTELYNAARHHKNPEDDIFKRADSISAGMDRYDDEMEGEDFKRTRLYSIFDIIELQYSIIDEKGNVNPRWHYLLQPLQEDNTDTIFPSFREDNVKDDFSTQKAVEEYKNLWNKFEEEVRSIQHHKNPPLYFNELYWLLEKYTWCIPSATNAFPDISLFDHMKTTAAIASIIYKTGLDIKFGRNEYLIYAGDVSGIQDYIFGISEAQGVGGIAKRLRGRSFFINMLSETLARHILEKLGYTQANINFCGGGNFELLLANTQSTKSFLEDFEKNLNVWLLKNYQGELGFVGAYHEVSSDEIKKSYNKCKEAIDEKIATAKLRKYANLIENKEFWIDSSTLDGRITMCPSCNLKLVQHVDEICEACEMDKRIGSALPKSDYICFKTGENKITEGILATLSFGDFGSVYLMENNIPHCILAEDSTALYSLSSRGSQVNARYPVAKTLPYAIEKIDGLPSEEDENGVTTVNPGQTVSFTTLAHMAEGDKRIGILKMDVDNLGLIFSQGFPSTLSKELVSISRIATLSRTLSNFFNIIIDQICKEIFDMWKKHSGWQYKHSISNIFYLTFSGGDDLLIIGPWEQIIELAREVRKKFKRFTCENPNLSISAGIYICKPKYPINMAVKKADEALKQSKSKGKNRITVIGETIVWNDEDKKSRVFQEELKSQFTSFSDIEIREDKIFLKGETRERIQKTLTFEELIAFAEKLWFAYKEQKISRKFIYRLLEAKEIFFQINYNDLKQREEEIHNHMFIPYLLYNIERNVKSDEKTNMRKVLITEGNAEKYVRQAKFPCKYVLMKTRN